MARSAFRFAAVRTALFGGLLVLLVSVCASPSSAGAAARCESDPRVLAESAPGRIVFGDRMQLARLASTCGPIAPTVRRAGAGVRFFLVVEDLRASTQPGAVFDISLAPATRRAGGRMRMLGTLNFFNAHPAAAGKGRRVSYDVTEALKTLAEHDRLASGVALSIAPMSRTERGSDASAGAIRLVMQAH